MYQTGAGSSESLGQEVRAILSGGSEECEKAREIEEGIPARGLGASIEIGDVIDLHAQSWLLQQGMLSKPRR